MTPRNHPHTGPVVPKMHRADRWVLLAPSMKEDVESFYFAAIAKLAVSVGWHPGPLAQQPELAGPLVLSGHPPPGWPQQLPPIEITLHAVSRHDTMVATERWILDPDTYDLGAHANERILTDKLTRLPHPHEGALLLLAVEANHQQLLAQASLYVTVGIPRPKPLTAREQMRYTEMLGRQAERQDQRMLEMFRESPQVIASSATVIRAMNERGPVPTPAQKPPQATPEMLAMVQAGTWTLIEYLRPLAQALLPPPQPAHPQPQLQVRQQPPRQAPPRPQLQTRRRRARFDAWGLEE